jgi:hypothetical protein
MKTENLQLIRVVHVDAAGATKTIAKANLVFLLSKVKKVNLQRFRGFWGQNEVMKQVLSFSFVFKTSNAMLLAKLNSPLTYFSHNA